MIDPKNPSEADDSLVPPYTGPERRSGLDRRQKPTPQPPSGQEERRRFVRRKGDRILLEGTIRIGEPGPGGRLYRRVRLEVPIFCRPLDPHSPSPEHSLRGLTHTLAPGGLGMVLDEQVPIGTFMEVLVRFGGDLLPADVRVMSIIPVGSKFLHNCRFTRLGTADRNWLTEYLRVRDAPSA